MKVSILIRHVSVSTVHKLTWEFMGEREEEAGGIWGGVHYDSIFILLPPSTKLCLLLPPQV